MYFIDQPIGGRRGNTIVGYSFGVFAALAILYLTYFGIRKRSYRSSPGNLVKALSSHVWLGVLLIIIVPFHSGFHFGWNVHALTYLVMTLVVVSGIFGAIFYRILPADLASQRGAEKPEELLSLMTVLDQDVSQITKDNQNLINFASRINFDTEKFSKYRFFLTKKTVSEKDVLALLAPLPNNDSVWAIQIVSLVERKVKLLNKMIAEARAKMFLRLWLFFHVPLTCLLLVLLFVHIFSTLFYWT